MRAEVASISALILPPSAASAASVMLAIKAVRAMVSPRGWVFSAPGGVMAPSIVHINPVRTRRVLDTSGEFAAQGPALHPPEAPCHSIDPSCGVALVMLVSIHRCLEFSRNSISMMYLSV